jgi:hypothetical protein
VKKYKKHFKNGYFVNGDEVKSRNTIFKQFNEIKFKNNKKELYIPEEISD